LSYAQFATYLEEINFASPVGDEGKKFSGLGASPPDSLTRGSASGPRWRLGPHIPVIGSRSALVMGFSPPPQLLILATSLGRRETFLMNSSASGAMIF